MLSFLVLKGPLFVYCTLQGAPRWPFLGDHGTFWCTSWVNSSRFRGDCEDGIIRSRRQGLERGQKGPEKRNDSQMGENGPSEWPNGSAGGHDGPFQALPRAVSFTRLSQGSRKTNRALLGPLVVEHWPAPWLRRGTFPGTEVGKIHTGPVQGPQGFQIGCSFIINRYGAGKIVFGLWEALEHVALTHAGLILPLFRPWGECTDLLPGVSSMTLIQGSIPTNWRVVVAVVLLDFFFGLWNVFERSTVAGAAHIWVSHSPQHRG